MSNDNTDKPKLERNKLKLLKNKIDEINSKSRFLHNPNTDDKPIIKKLSEKQLLACTYILEGNSVKQSLLKAGYSEAYASQPTVFYSESVKDYINKRKKEIEIKSLYSIQQVEEEIMSLYNELKETGEYYNERIKVLEMIMKYKQMYAPDIQQTNNTQINFNLEYKELDKQRIEDVQKIIDISDGKNENT